LVPLSGRAEGLDISVMNNKPAEPRMLERNMVYAVRKGDVLSSIAKRHGVTVTQIKSWNGGIGRLLVGQKLILKHTSFDKIPLTSSEQRAHPAKKRM
ncbi:MAG: LysM peptidoglycan-binding domain-containing protein, partial [Nitrosospira sp.]